nr:DHA2 family efflux MFS transporter permease subunit [Streptomonospora sp. PA3]
MCTGFFMTLLDLTIVNIAIPDMTRQLGAPLDLIMWVINGYTLALAVLIITAGRLGDLFGQRRLFLIGVAVFTAASALCGLAVGVYTLIAARVLQGVGAAILMPQSMALVVRVFPADRRGAALGVWGSVAGLATIAGPTLGGLLVSAFDWRFIFFVNVPLGAVALALAWALIPRDPSASGRARLDLTGVLLATAALTCLSFGLIEGERFDWGRIYGPLSIPLLLAASAVLFAVLAVQQRARQPRDPLIPFVLFADRNFGLMSLAAALVSVAMLGFFLMFSIHLQSVAGMSALEAGLTMAPMSVVSMVTAPVVGRLIDRLGGKHFLAGGSALFAGGVGWLVWLLGVQGDWLTYLPPLLVMGLGVGSVFGPMNTLAMYRVRPSMAGAGSGVLNTVRQLGSVLGTAVVAAVMQAVLAARLADRAERRAGELPPEVREPFVSGLVAGARRGVEVGGAAAVRPQPPPGVSDEVAAHMGRLAGQVFRHAFVDTAHVVGLLPVAALAATFLCALLVRDTRERRGGRSTAEPVRSAASERPRRA